MKAVERGRDSRLRPSTMRVSVEGKPIARAEVVCILSSATIEEWVLFVFGDVVDQL